MFVLENIFSVVVPRAARVTVRGVLSSAGSIDNVDNNTISAIPIISAIQVYRLYFTARCTVVQSTVLRLHVVRLSVCPLLWRAYGKALTDGTIPDHLCPLSLDWRAPKTPIAIISRTGKFTDFNFGRYIIH